MLTLVFGGNVATGGYSLPGPVYTSTSRSVKALSALADNGIAATASANKIREVACFMEPSVA